MQFVQQSRPDDQATSHSLITKFPILGPEGRAALIGGTALDITERIQMEDALRVARAQAEKSTHQMTQLQKVTAALSQALTPAQIAEMVVEQGIPVLGAASASVMLLNEEDQVLEIVYSSASPSAVRPFARFPLSMPTPVADAIRSGSVIWIKSKEEYLERYPNLAEMINKWDNQVAVAVPMNYKGHSLGALALSFGKTNRLLHRSLANTSPRFIPCQASGNPRS